MRVREVTIFGVGTLVGDFKVKLKGNQQSLGLPRFVVTMLAVNAGYQCRHMGPLRKVRQSVFERMLYLSEVTHEEYHSVAAALKRRQSRKVSWLIIDSVWPN